jgi:hypothetical protein
MNLVIASSVNRVEKPLAAGETDQLKTIAVGASQVVGKLIGPAPSSTDPKPPTIKRKSTALWATSP